MKPTLTILVGISASGKSTKAKELAIKYNAIIISTDMIRGEIGEVQDQSNNTEVFKLFHQRIKDGLMNGYNVIADATNINMKSRRAIIDYVKNVGCNIIAYVMTKPIGKCIEDNINRKYPVPKDVITKQMMNFQIPFYEEGFDKIIIDSYNYGYIDDNFINTLQDDMDGFNQNNPHHNEDLLCHCMTVFEGLLKYFAESGNKINRILLLSSQVHDYAKILTQKTDENGISHYYQHENVGAYYLLSHYQDLVATCYLSNDEMLEMLFYVNYHMMPMNWNSDKSKDKWKKIFGEDKFNNLILFNKCDKIRE